MDCQYNSARNKGKAVVDFAKLRIRQQRPFLHLASIVWTTGCIAKIVVTRLVGVDSQIKGDRVEREKDKTIEGT